MSDLFRREDEVIFLIQSHETKFPAVANEYDPTLCGLGCQNLNSETGHCAYFKKELAKYGIEWVRCEDCYR